MNIRTLSPEVKRVELTRRINAAHSVDTVKSVWTPFELVEQMLAGIELNGSILVLSDLGFLPVLKWKGVDLSTVTFTAHTLEQENLANQMRVGKVLQVGYNKPIEEMERLLMGLKFDIIVGNPPYGNLHLPILKKAVEHLAVDGTSITIQPVRWLQDPVWKFKRGDAAKYQSFFDGKIDSIKIVPNEEATRLFNALMSFDLGIFTIKARGGNLDYSSVSNTRNGHIFGTTTRILQEFNFFKRAKNYDFTQKHFFPLISIVSAGGSGRGLGTVTELNRRYGYFWNGLSVGSKYGDGLTPEQSMKANKRATLGKVTNWRTIEFDTEHELKNFYDFLGLTAFRFYVFVTTLDVHVQDKFLPIPDYDGAFKEVWTNERFYGHFGLTEEEQRHIAGTMAALDTK